VCHVRSRADAASAYRIDKNNYLTDFFWCSEAGSYLRRIDLIKKGEEKAIVTQKSVRLKYELASKQMHISVHFCCGSYFRRIDFLVTLAWGVIKKREEEEYTQECMDASGPGAHCPGSYPANRRLIQPTDALSCQPTPYPTN